MLLAIANENDMFTDHVDISQAFTQGKLQPGDGYLSATFACLLLLVSSRILPIVIAYASLFMAFPVWPDLAVAYSEFSKYGQFPGEVTCDRCGSRSASGIRYNIKTHVYNDAKILHLIHLSTRNPFPIGEMIHAWITSHRLGGTPDMRAALRARESITADLQEIDRICTWVYWTAMQEEETN